MDACNRSGSEFQDLKRKRPSRRWRRPGRTNEKEANRRRSCSAPFASSEPGAPIGDRQAAWLNGLRRWAEAIAYRYGVRRSDIDDVVQETFTEATEQWSRFTVREGQTEEEGRRRWITGILWRTACASGEKAGSREKRFRPYDEELNQVPDANQPSPEKQLADKQLVEVLLNAEGPESVSLFFSHSVEATPAKELAESRGTPEGTVYTRVRAAKQRMTFVLRAHQRISVPLRSR